ncbi:MAG: serine hydrolase [Bacteroidota bacterium]
MANKKRRRRIWRTIWLTLLIGLLVGTYRLLPVSTAYASKTMCSCVYLGDRDPASVLNLELENFPYNLSTTEIDSVNQIVSSSVMGLQKKSALYREGIGCTVISETDAQALRTKAIQPVRMRTRSLDSTKMYWPVGDVDTFATPKGVDMNRLQVVVDSAFLPNEEGNPNTRATLVIHKGKILAEQYAEGVTAKMRQRGWSMTKSVTNALIGIAAKKGLIDIYAPAPVPQWQQDERSQITTDHLLRMSSGLSFTEFYFGRTDATRMLYLKQGAGNYAIESSLGETPNTTFSYSSGTSNILQVILKNVVGDEKKYLSFPYTELFDKIGMTSTVMEPDASNTYVGSSFMFATPRDWARFGLLYLHDGIWNGERILPEGWVEYTNTRTPTSETGVYGAQFWKPANNPKEDGMFNFFVWPGVPEDTFFAEGFEGQAVVIIPSRATVIVRLGVTHGGGWDLGKYVTDVLETLPKE